MGVTQISEETGSPGYLQFCSLHAETSSVHADLQSEVICLHELGQPGRHGGSQFLFFSLTHTNTHTLTHTHTNTHTHARTHTIISGNRGSFLQLRISVNRP